MRDRDKILGVALIVLGALFLLGRVVDVGRFAWPLFVIIPGLILLGSAFFGRRDSAALAVPGAIVTTIGLILFVLNATDHWEAWAYSWALIVAGVGAGNFIYGALSNDHSREREGLRTVYVGLTLFAVFGVFFEFLIFGGLGGSLRWLIPLALIGAGVYMLFFRDPQSPFPWVTPREPDATTPPAQPAGPTGAAGAYPPQTRTTPMGAGTTPPVAGTPQPTATRAEPVNPGQAVPPGTTPPGAPPPPVPEPDRPAPERPATQPMRPAPDATGAPTEPAPEAPAPAEPSPSDERLGGPVDDGATTSEDDDRY